MKLFHIAVISTGMILALGATLLTPIFSPNIRGSPSPLQTIMLSFDIDDLAGMPEWCDELSSTLRKHDVKATIFIVGKVAEQYPECVRDISSNDKLDIGSKTYSHVSLQSIQDYELQLQEVKKGKDAVDQAGNIYTRSFKAPFGATDENIYSLLNRTDILADFSYAEQYNKYHEGYYIWFGVSSYSGADHPPNFFKDLPKNETPIIINFDNHDSIETIRQLVVQVKADNIELVNASELTRIQLTIRNERA